VQINNEQGGAKKKSQYEKTKEMTSRQSNSRNSQTRWRPNPDEFGPAEFAKMQLFELAHPSTAGLQKSA